MKSVSDKRRAENIERREKLYAAYGRYPRCELCAPLRANGIVTGCDGNATDADEILRRSAGGSITDLENIRPAGRSCHRWLTEHPAEARAWGLELRR